VSFEEKMLKCHTKLSDIHDVVLVLQNCGLVVVNVKIIGRAEYGHDARESRRPGLAIHPITSVLGFVGAYDRQKVVLLEECACSRIGEEVRASSHMIMDEKLGRLFLSKFLQRIGPQDIAH
jgi:hypothetical protein